MPNTPKPTMTLTRYYELITNMARMCPDMSDYYHQQYRQKLRDEFEIVDGTVVDILAEAE